MATDIIYINNKVQEFCFTHATRLAMRGVHIESVPFSLERGHASTCIICDGEATEEDVEGAS
jgi:hypothetical protein